MIHNAASPPNLLTNFETALGGLQSQCLGLVADFDGTLSEFVPVLENAVIHPDVLEPLRRLSRRLTLTSVISGRAARDVERRVGIEGIVYVGNHGAEYVEDGMLRLAEGSEASEAHLQQLLEHLAAAADDTGLVLENKIYSASLHFRRVSDEGEVVRRLRLALDSLVETGGFEFFWGNKILEIRRENGINKGTALDALMESWQLDSVIFLGDDTTDADALRALRRRRASGTVSAIGIAVIQDGTPQVVLDNADYSLNGVPEVTAFLRLLNTTLS